jgi:ATP-dependent helicase HrpB
LAAGASHAGAAQTQRSAAAAQALLGELGALDGAGRITGLGREMARLGAHPRLAAMMLAARSPGEAAMAAELAAILEERDPLRAPDAPADIGLRLAALAGHEAADRGAVSRINRAASQYKRRLRVREAPEGDPARLIAAGFPDRIAQRRGEPGSFRMAGGGGARLAVSDPLARANLLAVASLERRRHAALYSSGGPLQPQHVQQAQQHQSPLDEAAAVGAGAARFRAAVALGCASSVRSIIVGEAQAD